MSTTLIVIAVIEVVLIIAIVAGIIILNKEFGKIKKQSTMMMNRKLDIPDIPTGNNKLVVDQIATSMNIIKNNLMTFIETTKDNVTILSSAIDQLSQAAEVNQDGSEQISNSLSLVVTESEEQLETVRKSLDLIEINTTKLEKISTSTKDINNLLDISVTNCKNGIYNLENYEKKMDLVTNELHSSKDILDDFTSAIDEINEIGAFIIEISESLQLLAFNASIEAARVGGAGSGFAIVAKEMGVMSEKTKEGVGNINAILGRIVESNNQVNTSINRSVDIFENSNEVFKELNQSFRSIDTQSRAINKKMIEIYRQIRVITENSIRSKEAAEKAFEATETITSGTEEIAAISNQVSQTSLTISDSVDSLDYMLSDIQQLIKQFTTAVEPIEREDKTKPIKIAFFSMLDNDFWHGVRRGVLYAKEELAAHNVEVEFIPYMKWDDTKEFKHQVDRYVANGVDGIIFPGFIGSAISNLLEAHKKGVKVFCFNCHANEQIKIDACFQADVEAIGARAAVEMKKALNKSGKVVVMAGSDQIEDNVTQQNAFAKEISSTKNMEVVEICYNSEDFENTYKRINDYLDKYLDLKGIFVTNGFPLAVAKAIENRGLAGKVAIVSTDKNKDILREIKKGVITATVGPDQFGQGHDPVVWMYNSIVSGKPVPTKETFCHATVIDGSNAGNMV